MFLSGVRMSHSVFLLLYVCVCDRNHVDRVLRDSTSSLMLTGMCLLIFSHEIPIPFFSLLVRERERDFDQWMPDLQFFLFHQICICLSLLSFSCLIASVSERIEKIISYARRKERERNCLQLYVLHSILIHEVPLPQDSWSKFNSSKISQSHRHADRSRHPLVTLACF